MVEGRLEAIWIKRMCRGPMDPVGKARLVAGAGIEGNANQGGWRQVTLLDGARWDEACRVLDADVDPTARRANLLVRGVELEDSRGRVLWVGACRIRIRGETRPCERMDEAYSGLRDALGPRWRGGAFGVILDDGEIGVGDPVVWSEES